MRKRAVYVMLGILLVLCAVTVILLKSNYHTTDDYDGVTMMVDNNKLRKDGLTIIIQNDTEKDLTFGEYYILERKLFGTWFKLLYKPSMLLQPVGWNAIGLMVPSNSSQEFEINWDWLYGKLNAGTYRIIKKYIVDYPEAYDLTAEFIISKNTKENSSEIQVTKTIDSSNDVNQTTQITESLNNKNNEEQTMDASNIVSQEVKSNELLDDVSQILMKDDLKGWALLKNGTLISTEDEWKTNQPIIQHEGYDTVESSASISYQDNTLFLIGFLSKNQYIDVYYSTDEGTNWSESYINDIDIEAGSGQIFSSFISNQNGYILYCGGPALGMMAKILFKTTDGGKTFEKVSDVSYINGYPTGIEFNQDGVGFITCSYHGDENAYLYTSKDHGNTWNTITLQPPDDVSFAYINGYPPRFTGETGFMIIEYAGEQSEYIMYSTSDSGSTWTPDGSVSIESESMQGILDYSLCNRDTAYIVEDTGKLYKRVYNEDGWK